MTISKISVVALLIINTCSTLSAQNKASLGFNIGQNKSDFGLGVHFISPYFAKKTLAFKVATNIQWLEYFSNNQTVWSPYGTVQIGLRGKQPVIDDKIFIYGEGGSVLVKPNSNFSGRKSVFGGYGLFGFEFFTNDKFCYYLELGGIGTGAIADNVSYKPIYSNGFSTNVGFRIKL